MPTIYLIIALLLARSMTLPAPAVAQDKDNSQAQLAPPDVFVLVGVVRGELELISL
jgi:hypothetical protein